MSISHHPRDCDEQAGVPVAPGHPGDHWRTALVARGLPVVGGRWTEFSASCLDTGARTRVARVRRVTAQASDDVSQAEDVCVEVEADDRRLGAAHATCCLACARRGFSYASAQATSRGVRP